MGFNFFFFFERGGRLASFGKHIELQWRRLGVKTYHTNRHRIRKLWNMLWEIMNRASWVRGLRYCGSLTNDAPRIKQAEGPCFSEAQRAETITAIGSGPAWNWEIILCFQWTGSKAYLQREEVKGDMEGGEKTVLKAEEPWEAEETNADGRHIKDRQELLRGSGAGRS